MFLVYVCFFWFVVFEINDYVDNFFLNLVIGLMFMLVGYGNDVNYEYIYERFFMLR